MNTRSLILASVCGFMLISFSAFAQKNAKASSQKTSWQKEWKKADSLSDLGLPKSAMEIVDRIYSSSKSGRDVPQFIKAVIYKIRLNSFFREDFLLGTIHDLEEEVKAAQEPSKQVLRSILAEVYSKYYENNKYRFNDRSLLSDMKADSVQTWDEITLIKAIYGNYLASLQNEKLLKSISILDYKAIIEIPESGYRNNKSPNTDSVTAFVFRPTLFDFLGNRALDYFTSSAGPKNRSVKGFLMDDPGWFSQAEDFIKLKLPDGDSLSQELQALKIFRDIESFHLNDKNPAALIDADLSRLSFVREKAVCPNNDSLYLDALKRSETRFKDSPWSSDISFSIATFYQSQGGAKPIAPAHKYDLKTALDICETTIKRFPGSDGAKNCRILANTIRNKELEIRNEAVVSPGNPSLAIIYYRNLKQTFFRLFKVDQSLWEQKKEKNKKAEMNEFLATQKEIRHWEQALPDFGDFRTHTIETILPESLPGYFVILASSDSIFPNSSGLTAFSDYVVSSLNYISRHNSNGSMNLYVFGRDNGLPLAGIKVETWMKTYNYRDREWESKKIYELISDDKGFVTLPPIEQGAKFNNLYCRLIVNDDVLTTGNFYQYPVSPVVERAVKQTSFFTDRAIYRPGQTIYFKGILMEKKGERIRLLTKETTRVVFTDVNGRKVAEQLFTTNGFGSFNGSFIAPSDVLAGQMYISNESGSASFSVEQYKRPDFEIIFDPLEGNYKLNESLAIKGKAMAFAGNAISHAKVKYRVVRGTRFPWWERWYMPFPSSPETEIANGIVNTDAEGAFSFSFTAVPDYSLARSTNPLFDFKISVDVTDINGETQSSEESVAVGFRSMLLSVNMPDKFNLRADSLVKFGAANLNGRPTPVDIKVNIFRIQVPGRTFLKRYWDDPDTSLLQEASFHKLFPGFSYGNESDTSSWKSAESIVNTVINTAKDSVINLNTYTGTAGKPGRLQPGVYEILLSAGDPFGEKVSLKRFFTVYDPLSEQLPGSPANWFVPLKTTAKPGDTVSFLVGSTEKDVKLMMEVFDGDSLVSRRWTSISNSQIKFDVRVLESFRGNFSVNVVFSKLNRVYQNSQLIAVPYADKRLNIVFETFRSKLQPGQKEQWKIRISNAEKKPVSAEFLASMYDASLDAFRANPWSFGLPARFFGSHPWEFSSNYFIRSGSASGTPEAGEYSAHLYPMLNWFGMNYFGGRHYPSILKSGRKVNSGMVLEKTGMADSGIENPEAPPPPEAEAVGGTVSQTVEKPKASPEKTGFLLRKDFRETAFFFPDLLSDSAGGLSLSFTAPGSLTRWKFQGFAHTALLDYGLIEKELVTSKELMVMPNNPRFVRQGDNLVFSATVVNLSGLDLNARVRLELKDGFTMKSIDSLVAGQISREIPIHKGERAGISWNIRIPDDPGLSLIQYSVFAEAGAFSDGEENFIPVLPNRMMVTESLPLPVRDKGSFDFSFDKLLTSSADKTLENFRLTLEFASNPAWYAIQALPALNEKQYDDAFSVFGAFYSNSIASHIMNSDPKIRSVFESWKNMTPDALLSNLEKNTQLKSVLLQQTPWVMEATTETGNRRKLGLYFDPENLTSNLQKNLQRLQKLQTAGGGWTWFEGMPESRFISQNIIGGLAHLEHLGVEISEGDPQTGQMLSKGVKYMDDAFVKAFEEMKRRDPSRMKDKHLTSMEIQYLYARSYFLKTLPLPSKVLEALNYYISQAGQYWTSEDLSAQAMLALALDRLGKTDVSALIIRSLSERALHSNEMGMYWAGETGVYPQQQAVETQALLIEAYDEVTKDAKAVGEMKIWLLKQKQTQSWRSSRATVEACYALLLRGTSLLSEDPEVKIFLGRIKVDPSKLADVKKEAGTGYFQMSWSGSEITPEMGKIKVSKGSDGISWGAVYWQYFQDMDRITSATTNLKLEKKLFVERNTPSGPVLETIPENGKLKVGDKLKVRIVLTSDRDLEYVHMGDQRASAFEPLAGNTVSGYRYQDGLGYYQTTTDASTDFFFEYIPRGTYVFEYPLLVNAAGDYSNGITTIQCLYAPEFSAHSEGIRVKVDK